MFRGAFMPNKICVFGDSVAKGVVFDHVIQKYSLLKNGFADQLANIFSLSVTNYAKFGCTVTKGLELVKKHLDKIPDYDYIVLEFGGNDCDFDWAEVSKAPTAPQRSKTPLHSFIGTYPEMIRLIRENGGVPVLLSLPPIDAERYFQWITQGLDSDAILRFLGDEAHIYRWHEMYNMAVYRVANEENVPLIDITSDFLEMCHYQSCFCADGIHPNEKGHAAITKQIVQFVQASPEKALAHSPSAQSLACG